MQFTKQALTFVKLYGKAGSQICQIPIMSEFTLSIVLGLNERARIF